ncbi:MULTISPECIES: cobyrinate a,c-diamide synthase [unclassified Mesorhizobium]|uniref:cobyrinate a,c-diamide synthase n=1 Tax=unclassified Mesorhizobium TaxID=325217 RepID=UPI0003CE5041|nr:MULTISPECIES: cobyrinate a,c-diamide synthase [unclassified Mesorhizobium]ESX16216.1 cobyrinic acid a,c-diamide synthase [Mesorhizobium sp. LSJC255A00]ESX29627.1 cobyrinic acid a,c-diamide synthase [Mesorhizobium sp. LSHC440B00]ESX35450.1 cobyrinic acid a,c-diamide synthase [Mesorhizobium sp. LSHC432A00]ESX41663.1 cobyrinic acid a,c-diamide synthase [Mesorhizobium sp. LSHC440A00]ESX76007.1 cobyrinic acid a,c-diamide synthase [Mesorhizobium sp. LSHC414A00]
MTRAIIIGAPRSGSGKTSVTIGILRALARRGIKVRGAKSGPDYIDPGFHTAATGLSGVNLDSWAMSPDLLNALAGNATEDADFFFLESAMGLFDGIPAGQGRTGSAADLARLYHLPVLLVLDVSGQSTTAAAVAKGFATYDSDVRMAGIVLNRLGSERHRKLCSEAIETLGLPVVGAILRDPTLNLPERHLGLVQAGEYADLMTHLDRLADMVEKSLDLDAIMALAAPFSPASGSFEHALQPPGQRIALAEDAAFTFLYPHVAGHWRQAGAEIVPFSPLADEAPAQDCDVCWLPGGYPELHAGSLAAATNFRAGMARFAETKPIHGECGGFMVLGEALEDAAGETHAMLGLLGHSTSFAKRKMNLGYREARLRVACPLGPQGALIRGHEFHYAQMIATGNDEPLADLADGQGNPLGASGYRRGHVSGTFFHAIARGA